MHLKLLFHWTKMYFWTLHKAWKLTKVFKWHYFCHKIFNLFSFSELPRIGLCLYYIKMCCSIVLLHFIQFRSISFNFVQFRSVSFNFIQFHSISFNFVQFCSILFNFVQFHLFLFNFVQFRSILETERWQKHNHMVDLAKQISSWNWLHLNVNRERPVL